MRVSTRCANSLPVYRGWVRLPLSAPQFLRFSVKRLWLIGPTIMFLGWFATQISHGLQDLDAIDVDFKYV